MKGYIAFVESLSKQIDLHELVGIYGGGIENIDYASNKNKKLIDLSPLTPADRLKYQGKGRQITYADTQKIRKNIILTTQDGIDIYKVDSEYIRDNIYIDWTMGGHAYVYPNFIPENEIWLESTMNLEDTFTTAIHEITERREMKVNGKSYNNAHDLANLVEQEYRNKYGKNKF